MSNDHISIVGGDVPANQETYDAVREYIVEAQKKVNVAVNSAMVTAYWNIGKQIYEACGENERAEYGKNLLHFLSEKLTAEFGKGFEDRRSHTSGYRTNADVCELLYSPTNMLWRSICLNCIRLEEFVDNDKYNLEINMLWNMIGIFLV